MSPAVSWRDASPELSPGLHELVDGLPEWAQRHPRLDEALEALEGHAVTETTRHYVLAILKGMDNAPPPRFAVRLHTLHGDWSDMLLPRPYVWSDGDYTNEIWAIGVKLGTKYGEGGLLDIYITVSVPPRLARVRDRLFRRGQART